MGSEIRDNTTENSSYPISVEPEMNEKYSNVRCYCNLPQCVPSDYMCKSDEGVCFTKRSESQTGQKFNHKDLRTSFYVKSYVNKPIRGCVEMLPRIEQIKCKLKANHSNKTSRSESNEISSSKYDNSDVRTRLIPETTTIMPTVGHTDSHEKYFSHNTNVVLECCAGDVCNFEKINSFYLDHNLGSYERSTEVPNKIPMLAHTATFFVPVLGGVIFMLVVLVIIAARMLRKESNRGYRECVENASKNSFYNSPKYPFIEQSDDPILSAKSLQKDNSFKISEIHKFYTSTMKKSSENTPRHDIKFAPLCQLDYDQNGKPPSYPNANVFKNIQNSSSRKGHGNVNMGIRGDKGYCSTDATNMEGLTDSGISRCSSPYSELRSPCSSDILNANANGISSNSSRCTSPSSSYSFPISPIFNDRMKLSVNLSNNPDEVEPLT